MSDHAARFLASFSGSEPPPDAVAVFQQMLAGRSLRRVALHLDGWEKPGIAFTYADPGTTERADFEPVDAGSVFTLALAGVIGAHGEALVFTAPCEIVAANFLSREKDAPKTCQKCRKKLPPFRVLHLLTTSETSLCHDCA